MFKERIYLVGAELCWYFSNLSLFRLCARFVGYNDLDANDIFWSLLTWAEAAWLSYFKHTLICVGSLPVRVHV